MSCSKCKQKKYDCTCEKPKFCGCSTIVDTKCVVYDNCKSLEHIGVLKGYTLEAILRKLNCRVGELSKDFENAFIGTNVGFGEDIYKGQNEDGIEEFRSLSTNASMFLKTHNDTIEFGVDKDWLKQYLTDYTETDSFAKKIANQLDSEHFRKVLKTILVEDWFKNRMCQVAKECVKVVTPPPPPPKPEPEPQFSDCIKLVGTQNITKRIEKGKSYNNEVIGYINVENRCNKTFTLPAKTVVSEDGFTISYDNTEIPANTTQRVPLKANGIFNGSDGEHNYDIELNGTHAGVTLDVFTPVVEEPEEPEESDSYEKCVRINPSNYVKSFYVERNKELEGCSGEYLEFVNSCNTSYEIPETTLFTDDVDGGTFRAYVGPKSISGNETVNVEICYSGVYKNPSDSVDYTFDINGSTGSATVLVEKEELFEDCVKFNTNSNIEDNIVGKGGDVRGDFRASLFFLDTTDDIDLQVVEPSGTVINYDNKYSRYANGRLDTDANRKGSHDGPDERVENIVYKDADDMPDGTYVVKAENYYGDSLTNLRVQIKLKNKINTYLLASGLKNEDLLEISLSGDTFTIDKTNEKLVLEESREADTSNLGSNIKIERDRVYDECIDKYVKIYNECQKSFNLEETILYSNTENGGNFDIYLKPTTIDSYNNNVQICLRGTYKGEKDSVDFSYTLNGTKVSGTINTSEYGEEEPSPSEDHPPVTQDNTITLEGGEDKVITKSDLTYSDPDNDPITNVKFEGDVSTLYIDEGHTTPYVSGTELPIDFTLYHKAPESDQETTHTVTYKVKANGKWSN